MYKKESLWDSDCNYRFIAFLILIMFPMLNSVSVYSQEIAQSNRPESNSTLDSTEAKKQINRKRLNRRDWFYTGLEINYALLNTIDLITTFHSLKYGAREANPVARLYIKNKPLAIIIKGSMTAGILYGLTQVKHKNKKAAFVTLGLLNVIYGFVVQNNVVVYLQLKQ